MIKVVLADDHPLFREGIKNILHEFGKAIEVIGEAANVNELLAQLAQKQPDIVLTDLNMPGRNGLEGLKELKLLYPEIPVLVLSMYPEDRFSLRVMKVGAYGYLNKGVAPDELIKAVEQIALRRRKYITPEVAELMADNLGRDQDKMPHETLSDREEEIMIKIARGDKISDIANELFLSVHTVHTYRYRILKKLGVKSNVGIGHYAIEHELIE